MSSLYNAGWRQGSLFRAELTYSEVRLVDGHLERRDWPHDRWVVANQDCDLDAYDCDEEQGLVELRPVYEVDPPIDLGIRNRQLLLIHPYFVTSESPRLHVGPSVLQAVATEVGTPDLGERALAFKTWLGYRYDRPAVPPALVELAREIARRAKTRSGRVAARTVHDVLMQFDETSTPPKYVLMAVTADAADANAVRDWLLDVASRVRVDLGVLAGVDVATRSETSLELIENSYAADLSQLTWGSSPPDGAT